MGCGVFVVVVIVVITTGETAVESAGEPLRPRGSRGMRRRVAEADADEGRSAKAGECEGKPREEVSLKEGSDTAVRAREAPRKGRRVFQLKGVRVGEKS